MTPAVNLTRLYPWNSLLRHNHLYYHQQFQHPRPICSWVKKPFPEKLLFTTSFLPPPFYHLLQGYLRSDAGFLEIFGSYFSASATGALFYLWRSMAKAGAPRPGRLSPGCTFSDLFMAPGSSCDQSGVSPPITPMRLVLPHTRLR